MQRLIDDANKWGAENGKASDLSIDSFSDVVTAIEQVQEAQGIAGTTAKEAGSTIEGSVNAMKGAWDNLLTEFGKSDGDIGARINDLIDTIIGDGGENSGVLGNVIPRIGTIVTNVVQRLPEALATVGPQVADAVVQIIDGATGGLATQAIEFMAPVTDAIGGAIEGAFSWFSDNQGMLSDFAGKVGEFGGKVVEAFGGIIETVAPIVGELAENLIPILGGAFDVAGSAISAVVKGFQGIVKATQPIRDALEPIVDFITGTLSEGFSGLADIIGGLDIAGIFETIGEVVQGVVDVVQDAFGAIGDFFGGIGDFIADPVGTIQGGFSQLVGGADGVNSSVSSSFAGLSGSVSSSSASAAGAAAGSASSISGAYNNAANSVGKSAGKMRSELGNVNKTKINNKSAKFAATGNVIEGKAKKSVNETRDAANKFKGNYNATIRGSGNAVDGSAKRNIDNLRGSIDALHDKTITITTVKKTTGGSADGAIIPAHADGAMIPRWATGFIATEATMTDIGWIGEDGAEAVTSWAGGTAVVPLTNRKYTGPFASEISSQVLAGLGATNGGMGDVNVYLSYDASADASQMARDLADELRLVRLARGVA